VRAVEGEVCWIAEKYRDDGGSDCVLQIVYDQPKITIEPDNLHLFRCKRFIIENTPARPTINLYIDKSAQTITVEDLVKLRELAMKYYLATSTYLLDREKGGAVLIHAGLNLTAVCVRELILDYLVSPNAVQRAMYLGITVEFIRKLIPQTRTFFPETCYLECQEFHNLLQEHQDSQK